MDLHLPVYILPSHPAFHQRKLLQSSLLALYWQYRKLTIQIVILAYINKTKAIYGLNFSCVQIYTNSFIFYVVLQDISIQNYILKYIHIFVNSHLIHLNCFVIFDSVNTIYLFLYQRTVAWLPRFYYQQYCCGEHFCMCLLINTCNNLSKICT